MHVSKTVTSCSVVVDTAPAASPGRAWPGCADLLASGYLRFLQVTCVYCTQDDLYIILAEIKVCFQPNHCHTPPNLYWLEENTFSHYSV
jgi:hypothetical protein